MTSGVWEKESLETALLKISGQVNSMAFEYVQLELGQHKLGFALANKG